MSEAGRSGLQRGDVVEVTVEKGVYRGLGLSRAGGQVVFVPRALPGDRARVRVESVTSGYVRAALDALLVPGPGRRASPCVYFPRCGGCAYQELDYPAQLRLKEEILRESLERAGVPWKNPIPMRASPEEGWRMRASFHLAWGEEGLRLGLHEEGTRRVVDLPRCLQISTAMSRAARGLRAALEERPVLARRVQEAELAEALDGEGLVACLAGDLRPREATALAFLVDGAPWLSGLGVRLGRGRGRRYLALRGEPYVHATVLGLRLRCHVCSFFQANRFLVEELAREVVEAVPPGPPVLDLYAGVGLFALPLAARGERVTAIEWNPTAVEDARANSRAARLGNVRLVRGDIRRRLAAGAVEPGATVILDPPRAGAGVAVVRAVAAGRPGAVVYVSCDPPTLGRDLKAFDEEGYRPVSIGAFDMFPDTFHLETVVRLSR